LDPPVPLDVDEIPPDDVEWPPVAAALPPAPAGPPPKPEFSVPTPFVQLAPEVKTVAKRKGPIPCRTLTFIFAPCHSVA
jgi:hypothetical protein